MAQHILVPVHKLFDASPEEAVKNLRKVEAEENFHPFIELVLIEALRFATRHQHFILFLEEFDVDVHYNDESLLQNAIMYNRPEAVEKLIELGADGSAIDIFTPEYIAKYIELDVFRSLVPFCNPNRTDWNGVPLLHLVLKEYYNDDPRYVSSRSEKIEQAKLLIRHPDIDLHAGDDIVFVTAPFELQLEMVKKEPDYPWERTPEFKDYKHLCDQMLTEEIVPLHHGINMYMRENFPDSTETNLTQIIMDFALDLPLLP